MSKVKKIKERPRVEGVWRRAYGKGFRYVVKGTDADGTDRFMTVPVSDTDSDADFIRKCEAAKAELERRLHPPKTFESYMEDYFTKRSLADGSKYQYRHHLAGFGMDDEANARRVSEILKSGKSEGSIKQIVGIINTFFKYLIGSGLQVKNPVAGVRTGKWHHRTRIPSEREIETLLEWASDPEDELYVRLLLATGARCSTINALRICDLSQDNHVSLRNIKCSKSYDYPILITDKRLIELWRNKDWKADDPLFVHPVETSRRVKWACYKYIDPDQNGERISPHSFRHLFATRLIQQGVDLATVSKLLDHSSVATTLTFYARHSQDQLDAAIRGETKNGKRGRKKKEN